MSDPLFSFGLITDVQYADVPDMATIIGDRRFRLSKQKLAEAVKVLNTKDLEFVVHLGDVIDQKVDSFDEILPFFAQLKAPLWHVLGNHDFSGPNYKGTIDKQTVMKKLGLEQPYYTKMVQNWRFIIIDGNDEGVIEYPEGTEEYEKGKKRLEQAERQGLENAKTWNGALSEAQHKWLMTELEQAESKRQSTIIFSHQAIYPKHRENLLDDEELLPELVRFKSLRAFINGHNHNGNYGKYEHLHCLTLKGMVDTGENAFAVAHVYVDRIEIEGIGREPSRTLAF